MLCACCISFHSMLMGFASFYGLRHERDISKEELKSLDV